MMNDSDNDDDDVMAILTHSLARPQTGDDGLLCRGHGASSSRGAAAADAKNWKYFLNKQHSASGGSHTLDTADRDTDSRVNCYP